MKTTTDFQLVATDKLIPYVNNARTHSPEQIKKLRSSLREFGFVNPVIIDREYNVIAGHGRLMAAKEEGITEVPCVYVDHLTDAQKKAYILADNRMALDAGWDEELLAVEMQELQDLGYDLAMTGFDEKELADLFSDGTDSDAKDDDFDLTAALEKASFVVWTVGRHRLMCGDATSPEDVNTLMGDTKANLILTDPPYGVSFKSASGLTIQNDSMKNEEFYNFLLSAFKCMADHLEKGGAAYVFHADTEGLPQGVHRRWLPPCRVLHLGEGQPRSWTLGLSVAARTGAVRFHAERQAQVVFRPQADDHLAFRQAEAQCEPPDQQAPRSARLSHW